MYKHVVEIDDDKGLLIINRLFEDGSTVLFTQLELEDLKENPKQLIYMIGENILLDNPSGRKFLIELTDDLSD